MNCRRHGSKPTLALWMLVAVADLAILIAAAGPVLAFLLVAALAVVAGGVLAFRNLRRPRPEPVKVVARRRA
ncbi:hypothetical protein AMIS_74460 [Actinoplanes missouriensis 431]|uniref:Uncharacterized protein n=1 Tax=Actinoplanes missouriensis (strain ATCC 14538 / DSM 43046 / CBS 188.64 / JCM 3121 / NBRC 102363 / NCIMB 12654 / NRRL B-3342 / UNCC 431) TaxID=512565 RepID=I0HI29_ACTM4|nr:hypothetical protein [Actinoplanes missouriensis]BAL92666.1 hypothetical protein AMIS_74460 [Actinoplanes missouriensis 431]